MNRRDLLLLAATSTFLPHVRAGAWESDSFSNDDAMDWASQCAGSNGPEFILVTLNAALTDGYLEAPECSMAVAAAEVVAASKGKPSRFLPKELSSWLERQQKAEIAKIAPVAVKAVSRVLNGPKSELRELWQENRKAFPAWSGHMQSLIARLK
ncbi:DUF4259 domain-containing protein [Pelomonas sp. P7]|uniref:DUF4259 domain-containing protein n=1 Tax=Pelomonas caseinilytica TaxID=2906763 RepID=A0ABS8XKF7_9BURK|nr:DUF4259 domain-containing protein [Pelomonas sp. P7]MCE4539061.1 DUF4259 domain-containing protein [Pelomonas sp. P7]